MSHQQPPERLKYSKDQLVSMNIEWFWKENDFTKISLIIAFMWVVKFFFISTLFDISSFVPLIYLVIMVFTFKKTSLLFKVFLATLFLASTLASWSFADFLEISLLPAFGLLAGAVGVFLNSKHKRERTLSFKAMAINFALFCGAVITVFFLMSW